jgi:hypothetical protein
MTEELWFDCCQGQRTFHFPKLTRLDLEPTQCLVQWVPVFFSGGKVVGA